MQVDLSLVKVSINFEKNCDFCPCVRRFRGKPASFLKKANGDPLISTAFASSGLKEKEKYFVGSS